MNYCASYACENKAVHEYGFLHKILVLVPLCLPSCKVSDLLKSPLNIRERKSEILACSSTVSVIHQHPADGIVITVGKLRLISCQSLSGLFYSSHNGFYRRRKDHVLPLLLLYHYTRMCQISMKWT